MSDNAPTVSATALHARIPATGRSSLRLRPTEGAEESLAKLRAMLSEHRLWNNPLLKACSSGQLFFEDFRFVFAQYYEYSRHFTRYLAALMANCESDYFRSKLSENLWEEGGALKPEERHAEIFRNFLRDGLGLGVEAIVAEPYSRHFAKEYLDFCRNAPPAAASAFLSLGTEAVVADLYRVFLAGLRGAGVPEAHLAFFKIHIECDDEHAATIEEMMASYRGESDWFNTCRRAVLHALDLRDQFFTHLYEAIQRRRVQGLMDNIQARQSLAPDLPAPASLHVPAGQAGEALYENRREDLGIDFTVERLPFAAEVFDVRTVRIPAGKVNEKHRHAHESIFYVIAGSGRVLVNNAVIAVSPGDVAFVPRWAFHQTQNTGDGELVLLAVTDYGLTSRAFIGDYLRTARMKRLPKAAPRAVEAASV